MIVVKCTNCNKEKPASDFSEYHGRINKQCKDCRSYYNTLWAKNPNGYKDKRKEYYRQSKEIHRERNFKNAILKKYKLSVEEYRRMLEAQSNRCAICGMEFEPTGYFKACVDHSHQTNKVRGLLCRKCNVSLAFIESGLTEKAKEYLRVTEAEDKEPS